MPYYEYNMCWYLKYKVKFVTNYNLSKVSPLTFAGTAGTISAGIIRVFAVCMPIEGSLSRPTDVDRDQLA